MLDWWICFHSVGLGRRLLSPGCSFFSLKYYGSIDIYKRAMIGNKIYWSKTHPRLDLLFSGKYIVTLYLNYVVTFLETFQEIFFYNLISTININVLYMAVKDFYSGLISFDLLWLLHRGNNRWLAAIIIDKWLNSYVFQRRNCHLSSAK